MSTSTESEESVAPQKSATSEAALSSFGNAFSGLKGWFLAGITAASVAAAFELVTLLLTDRELWGTPGAFSAVLVMVGAALAVALPFALMMWAALAINGWAGPPQKTLDSTIDWLATDDSSAAARRVSLLASSTVALGLGFVLATVAIKTVGNPFAKSIYNAIMHAVFTIGALAGAGVVARGLHLQLTTRLRGGIESGKVWAKPVKTPLRAVLGITLLAALVGVAGVVILLERGLTTNYVFGALGLLLAVAGALPVGVLRQLRGAGEPSARTSMIRWAVSGLLLILGTVGLASGTSAPASAYMVARSGVLSTPVVRTLRGLTDFDGDGYSGMFGGGDCAPNNAEISPGMRDILDNGIDENCNGSDFTSATIVESPDPAYVDDHGLCGEQGCDFILITIDSLRSDRLGMYNPEVDLTPNLDALGARGARFDNAYCMGPGTILTMPQLFSVVHDTQLDLDWSRARQIGPRPLRESNLLFPQVLSRAGYNTGGIAGHFYLEPLRYGFDHFENEREDWAEHRDISSPGVTGRAIEMFDELSAEEGNFFQWVHYFDPHHDYMAHEPAHESLDDIERYDLEVKFTDDWIGRFIDHVDANSGDRPVVWIITADHGEGLGDHGIRYHNENFYDELCRIPLVITVPGSEPREIVGPVSLHDIGATVLNLADLPPEPTFEGRSLVDSISTGAEDMDRAVFHQAVYEQGGVDHEIFGVSTSEWRLFWNRLHGTVELYAVSDKREENNVEASNLQVRGELLETIEGFLHRVE